MITNFSMKVNKVFLSIYFADSVAQYKIGYNKKEYVYT